MNADYEQNTLTHIRNVSQNCYRSSSTLVHSHTYMENSSENLFSIEIAYFPIANQYCMLFVLCLIVYIRFGLCLIIDLFGYNNIITTKSRTKKKDTQTLWAAPRYNVKSWPKKIRPGNRIRRINKILADHESLSIRWKRLPRTAHTNLEPISIDFPVAYTIHMYIYQSHLHNCCWNCLV